MDWTTSYNSLYVSSPNKTICHNIHISIDSYLITPRMGDMICNIAIMTLKT